MVPHSVLIGIFETAESAVLMLGLLVLMGITLYKIIKREIGK